MIYFAGKDEINELYYLECIEFANRAEGSTK